MNVSEQNFPTVYKAFFLIELDNGGINRFSPKPDFYTVPEKFEPQLPLAEEQLSALSEDDLETVCNGEATDVENLVAAKHMQGTSKLLNLFFDDWIEDPKVQP